MLPVGRAHDTAYSRVRNQAVIAPPGTPAFVIDLASRQWGGPSCRRPAGTQPGSVFAKGQAHPLYTENAYGGSGSVVGLWIAATAIGGWRDQSGGVGPHQLHSIGRTSLIVANGGIGPTRKRGKPVSTRWHRR